jgi:hypothetical protein
MSDCQVETIDLLVENPLNVDSAVLIRMIEEDPNSFTQGRRNDDMVNWYLAKRIHEVLTQHAKRAHFAYIADFKLLKLTHVQFDALRDWDFRDAVSVDRKIHQLHQAYGTIDRLPYLSNLWIPAFYNKVLTTDDDSPKKGTR